MTDQLNDGALDPAAFEGAELTDEDLENIAGGFIYHDAGDPASHRKEAFYILNNDGKVLMKVGNMAKAQHWAGNLRTSLQELNADEFAKLRGL